MNNPLRHKRFDSNVSELSELDHHAASDPLLKPEDRIDPDDVPSEDPPLDWRQLLCLLWARFTEPVAFFVVFPFMPRMVRELGIAKTDEEAGYYAGLVESLFAAVQFCCSLQWGILSDRIGRKIPLIIGLLGSACSVLGLGLAKSFVALIVARCIAGVFNSNVPLVRAAYGELTTPRNRARAFSILPIAPGVAGSLGPLIGGVFAHSAERFPNTILDTSMFRKYPYLLPSAIAACIPLSATVLLALYFKETLPPEKRKLYSKARHSRPGLLQVATPEIRQILFTYGIFMALNTAALSLMPLYTFTSPAKHGLGLSSTLTGALFGIRGVAVVFFQVVLFPILERRYSAQAVFRMASTTYLFFYAGFASLQYIQNERIKIGTTVAFMVFWAFSNLGHSSVNLMITSAARAEDLGTLNGLLQSVSAAVRAFMPAVSSSLFALSVDRDILSGQLIWVVMFVLAFLLVISTALLQCARVTRLQIDEPTSPLLGAHAAQS